MKTDRAGPLLIITAVVILVLGLALGLGGIWLLTLGGSWYYVLAAAGLLLTGFLLIRRHAAALIVYAVVVAGTLIWALWEVGLDWWPLAARGDVIFVLGLLLLTPWITRALDFGGREDTAGKNRSVSALRGAGLPLTASLVVALVAAASNGARTVQAALRGRAVHPERPPANPCTHPQRRRGKRYMPLRIRYGFNAIWSAGHNRRSRPSAFHFLGSKTE